MLKIAICDDNMMELTAIAKLLNQYRVDKGKDIKYNAFHGAFNLLEAMRQQSYDVLILDILMPGIDGMRVAQEIRQFDCQVKIIFLTSSTEFAVDSYAVQAHYYLLKPGTANRLFPIMDRIFLDAQRATDSLYLQSSSSVARLYFNHIELLEVNNKKLLFHLSDGRTSEINGALLNYEEAFLCRKEYVKVHRSYLVNMEFVDTFGTKELITCAKKIVPISRLLFAQVREAYMQFLFIEKGVV